MVRPLKYTTKDRQRIFAGLRERRDSGEITKDNYEKRIVRLNRQEDAWRNAQKVKKQRAKAKREEGKVLQKAKQIERKRERYIESISLRQQGTQERFSKRVRATTYAVEPRVLLTADSTFEGTSVTSNEVINQVVNRILDEIDTSDRSAKLVVSVEVTSKNRDEEQTSTFTLGNAFKFPYNLGEISTRLINGFNRTATRGVGSDVSVFLTGIILKYVDNPTEGGCDTDTHHKRYNDLKIMSPKSTKNNCLFACIHHHLGKRILCDNTRKELGIELDTPIRINQIEKIAKHYDVCIHLFDMDANKIGDYNEESKNECNIMLFVSGCGKGHYVLIEGETHVCEECGKYWVKKHKCNLRRKMWVNRMSGNRNVIPAKVVQQEKFDTGKMLYFDLETFKPENSDAIVPYAASWFCDEKYYQSYGEDAWNEFVEYLMGQSNKLVCAYNGAGFDFHFLMSELLLRGEKVDNVILSNGRLMSFSFGNKMRVWDICLFTLSSLKDACKSFAVSGDNTKTEFDHFKIKSWEDVYAYRHEVEPYVKRDVLGMKEVVEKFSDMVYEIFKVHMTQFVTLSAMSYAIWTQSVDELIELPDTQKYEFIRESLYGGRTYPMNREFTSKQYNTIVNSTSTEELKHIYKTMDDWIFNADATSLYPTAMVRYEYPVGNSEWIENPADISKIGIYDVDVECNTELIVPILPQKTENGGISWNLLPRRGVYTSVDLENALQHGYKITKIHKGLVWNRKSDLFSKYIMECYKIKEENDENPVLRQIGKILMNALYGKMLEKARFEETKMCNNIEDVWKFQRDFSMTDVQFVKDKVVMIGLPQDEVISDNRIRKPSQIGTFILSYSRRHMLNAMTAICPKLNEHFFTYTDTDSLHIHCSHLKGLDEKGWLSKGLGQLSDDAKGGKIFREINLAPKLYMYLCLMPDGKIKTCMKSKGIPTIYLSPHLFEDADDLDDEEKLIVMEHRLKKVGLGRNIQTAWRGYDAFSILSVNMERTFYKNQWKGMDFVDGKWYPKK